MWRKFPARRWVNDNLPFHRETFQAESASAFFIHQATHNTCTLSSWRILPNVALSSNLRQSEWTRRRKASGIRFTSSPAYMANKQTEAKRTFEVKRKKKRHTRIQHYRTLQPLWCPSKPHHFPDSAPHKLFVTLSSWLSKANFYFGLIIYHLCTRFFWKRGSHAEIKNPE